MAQLVEHIVHIDGVTGSSPVATTREALESQGSRAFISAQCFKSCQKAAVGGLSLSKKSACGGLFRQKLKKCLRPGAQTQTVEKPMVLERAAFLASFGRSQRSRKMLRHKALGLCPKPRQGDDPPAPRTLSAACVCAQGRKLPARPAKPGDTNSLWRTCGSSKPPQMGYLTG